MTHHRTLRTIVLGVVGLALLGASATVPSSPADAAALPGTLLVFHGWPSRINAAVAPAAAAVDYSRYEFVVLGGGVELPEHPDHARTAAVLADPVMADTIVFGYVNLGVTNGMLTLEEVRRRVDLWKALGVDGVQLDAFGYDWEVTRARQNAAVGYVHSLGMPVMANGWLPADVFDSAVVPVYNPNGVGTLLGAGDYYMFESYWIRQGVAPSPGAASGWTPEYYQEKVDRLAAYRAQLGFSIVSVTTNDPADVFSLHLFHETWQKAATDGHLATGWGEYLFSSNDGLAPYRPRPAAGGEIQAVCGGLPATILGTPGADRLVGTGHPDVIAGLSGPDIVLGGAGNDIICGGAGNDNVRGGDGRDRLYGGVGADRLFGDAGNDRLFGQGGDDVLLQGGPGYDRARGGPGIDTCDTEVTFTCEA